MAQDAPKRRFLSLIFLVSCISKSLLLIIIIIIIIIVIIIIVVVVVVFIIIIISHANVLILFPVSFRS